MIYDVTHLTAYAYEAPVTSAVLALHLTPRSNATQRSLTHELSILPAPEHTASQRDFYGNVVDLVTIGIPHTELLIRSTARVEVMKPPGRSASDPPWELVVEEALSRRARISRWRSPHHAPA